MFNFDNISINENAAVDCLRKQMIAKFFNETKGEWLFVDKNNITLAICAPRRFFVNFIYDTNSETIIIHNIGFCEKHELMYIDFTASDYYTVVTTFTALTKQIGCNLAYDYDSMFFVVNSVYNYSKFSIVSNYEHINNIFFYIRNIDSELYTFDRLKKRIKNLDKPVYVVYNEGLEYNTEFSPFTFGKKLHINLKGFKFVHNSLFTNNLYYKLVFNRFNVMQMYTE